MQIQQINWRTFLCGLKATVINVHVCTKCNTMNISAIQVEPIDGSFKTIMHASDLEPKQPCITCKE